MKCVSTPTTTKKQPCGPCIHPFEYLIEQAYLGSAGDFNSSMFFETLDRILDKAFVFPNCKYCCPDCEGVYVLGNVETFLKFAEAVGLTTPPPVIPAINPASSTNDGTFGKLGGLRCCSNVYASVETLLKYNEAMGFTESAVIPSAFPKGASLDSGEDNPYVKECCNGFTECVDDLNCWITQNSKTPAVDIDRLLNQGIVEYGQIPSSSNCAKKASSSICKLVSLFDTYQVGGVIDDFTIINRAEAIERFLDKGLVISCDARGSMQIGSIETWLKWAEASGYTEGAEEIP